MVKFQKGWPPVRRDSPEEIMEEARFYEEQAKGWRSIPGVSVKKSSSSYRVPLEGKKGTLKDEFLEDMKRTFSDEDQLQVFEKYVQRIMHGRAGYGGQTRERAEGIVLRMWQELAEDVGGSSW